MRKATKTKLGIVEKAELLKSRVTKFEKFIATRYTPDQPLAAEVALEEVNEIWDEIEEQIKDELLEKTNDTTGKS